MSMRKILVSAVAAVMVAGGVSLAVAPTASADQTISVSCPSTDEVTLYVQPNEVISMLYPSGCTQILVPGDGSFYDLAFAFPVASFTIRGSVVEGESTVITWLTDSSETGTQVTLVVAAAPVAADAPPIPAWVQAYGRASADATCLDGWSPSWQSWAEPVTGGWVCARSIPSLG